MEIYRKTQIGNLIIFSFLGALVILLWFVPRQMVTERMIFGGLLIVTLSLFYSMTIVITPEHLIFSMGIGLIRKKIPLSSIEACVPTRISIIHGWGIKILRGGLQFNVTGLKAVDIKLKNGRFYRLGTPEPEKICQIIEELKETSTPEQIRH